MATSSYVQGAWGEAGDVILSLLPIVFLLVVTLVPRLLLRTAVSLPLAAILMWAIRAVYFGTGANFLNACLLAGVLDALTPISICFGAILLFETMDAAICEPVRRTPQPLLFYFFKVKSAHTINSKRFFFLFLFWPSL